MSREMNKSLLAVSAALEGLMGLGLLLAPSLIVSLLAGGSLDTPVALAVGRLAGAALLTLGLACWFGSRDPHSRATIGVIAAMLFYNVAASAILAHGRLVTGLVGLGLWPAILLHAVLAVWCLVCLQTVKHSGADRAQS